MKTLLAWGRYFSIAFIFGFLNLGIRRILFRQTWQQAWIAAKRFATYSLTIFQIKIVPHFPKSLNLDQQYIIVANHRSWFDQLALMSTLPRPIHILSKKEYFQIPIFGKSMQYAECVPVTNKTLTFDAYELLSKYIERGDSILFFLEGTRGSGRELLPFQNGAFKLAAKHGIPILPITILGSEQILSKHKSLLSIQSGTIDLIIDAPISFSKNHLKQQVESFESKYREQHNFLYDKHNQAKIRTSLR